MKYTRAALLGVVAIPLAMALATFHVNMGPGNTTELVEMVKPGTVLIANQIDVSTGGTGTGFILADNQIITNHHVIDGNGEIFVYSSNSQRKYPAKVVYADVIADIAIIRLLDWEVFAKNENPQNLKLGNSDEVKLGDKVVVIGHPWGLTWTISEGIMSAKERRLGQNPKYMDQVDAKLYQGNSGGPIFNEDGEIICVSNMMLALEGGSYGFCIPSNLVNKVVYDLNTFKEVRWRVLNVSAGLTEDGSYVILNSVEPNGAAAKAGLKEDDKILEVYTPNNHPKGVKISDTNNLITELAQLRGDDELVKILIERNGEKMLIDVKTNFRLSSEYTPDKGK